MIVDIIVRSLLLEKKLVQLFKESETIENAYFHKSIDLLKNSLMNVRRSIVIIMDIDQESSLDYFHKLKESFEDIKFIAISKNNETGKIINIFKLGFFSYIDLEFTSIELSIMLSKIHSEQLYMSSAQIKKIINWVIFQEYKNEIIYKKADLINTVDKLNQKNVTNIIKVNNYLTPKEKSVCEYLLKGYSYKEISDVLGISTFTINQRVRSIYRKLEVKSRSELSYKYL